MPRTIDLDVDPGELAHQYDRAGFGELSDAQLFDLVARAVAVPRERPANSFVLHAPLEVMARSLLLPLVPGAERRAARERMLWVAAKYRMTSEPVEPPEPRRFTSLVSARRALIDAITDGDLAGTDEVAAWLADHAPVDDVLRLADATIDLLAAAGHAPIAFFLLSRVVATSRSALGLLRPLVRELARAPQLRVQWVDTAELGTGDESAFAAALARTPRLGLPGNDFIFPLVHQVDGSGVARGVIQPLIPDDPNRVACASLRVAAHSMLQDDGDFAPYGWTHCLTLPHGIFEVLPWLADARRASAIAATYVVAFRAGESRADLDLQWTPEPVTAGLLDALHLDPTSAAAAWYHADPHEVAGALPALIGRAATHRSEERRVGKDGRAR